MLSVDEIKERIQIPSSRYSGNARYNRDFKKDMLERKIKDIEQFCVEAKAGRLSEYLQRQTGRTTNLMIEALSYASRDIPICFQGATSWMNIGHFETLLKYAEQLGIDKNFICNAMTHDRSNAKILFVDHYVKEYGMTIEFFPGQIVYG